MRRAIAGIQVRSTSGKAFIRFLHKRLNAKQKTIVFFANSNFVTKCQDLKTELSSTPGLVIIPDGVAMDLASYMLYKRPFRENLNGSDLIPRLLRESTNPVRIMLIGGHPHAVTGAALKLREFAGVEVVGMQDGYSLWDNEASVLDTVQEIKPDLLLVALGNPLQERWIMENRDDLPVTVIMGVGALIDFLSGSAKRAPAWMRSLRLEWAYRLYREPTRLAHRYTVGVLHFMALTIRHRLATDRT